MEWVEVTGKTVDIAVEAALEELGLASIDDADVEVLQEPSKGFLGMGGQDAIVKVIPKPKKKSRRRRGGGRKDDGESSEGQSRQGGRGDGQGKSQKGSAQKQSGPKGGKGDRPKRGDDNRGGDRGSSGPAGKQQRSAGESSNKRSDKQRRPSSRNNGDKAKAGMSDKEQPKADINEQAEIVVDFLTGLLDAFGLEGEVATRIEDDTLHIDVTGDQTEALVGPRGSIMSSVNELTRTVVQRKTHGAPRMRLDICGYTERRREALRIYSTRLGEQVREQGGEVALEAMHAADRKVVHDTIGEVEGVRSFSEGEEPHRYVVVAIEEGFEPTGAASSDDAGDETGDDHSDAPANEVDHGDTDDTDDRPDSGDSDDSDGAGDNGSDDDNASIDESASVDESASSVDETVSADGSN